MMYMRCTAVPLATLRFTTRAQQRGRLQEEILELFLKNVDESIESANFVW